jgi:hypothetical protein
VSCLRLALLDRHTTFCAACGLYGYFRIHFG